MGVVVVGNYVLYKGDVQDIVCPEIFVEKMIEVSLSGCTFIDALEHEWLPCVQ